MSAGLGYLFTEAKYEVLDYVDGLFPVWHEDELVVNMVGSQDDETVCVVTKKHTDEHLWIVYLNHDLNKVVYYRKQEKENTDDGSTAW